MKIGIHQPNFIPWLGYFNKIAKADKFIFLDTVQYNRRGLTNNNKIKTPNGELMLTVPVVKGAYADQKVNEVFLFEQEKSSLKLCRTIEMNYSKALFYQRYYPEFKEIMMKNHGLLMNLNIELIKWVMAILKINTELFYASAFEVIDDEDPTKRLIRLTKLAGGSEYLSGKGGFNYQDQDLFIAEKIKLTLPQFEHPIYKQQWKEFIPNLSIVDVIFNCGEEAALFLK